MSRTPPTLTGRARKVVDPSTPGRALPTEPHVVTAAVVPRALRVIRLHGLPVVLPLKEEDRYVMGRHDAADVVFESHSVSRLHGMVRAEGGRWLYEDYASSNGTLLRRGGQEPLDVDSHQRVELYAGDVLELGSPEDRLEFLAQAPAEVQPAPHGDTTTQSAAARAFAQRIELASRTRVPVFLLGPSGSGKTHTARLIHQKSQSQGPLVPINCARLPSDANALHSELLGHVRGAFTGAESARVGKLMHANGGTLFLDEVDSLPPLAQGFLLDVLEGTGDLSPLGSRELMTRAPVFRLVSASKVPLGQSTLRQDLCERLAEGHMYKLPTLEERREDIPGLMRFFVSEQAKMVGIPVEMTDEAVALAVTAPWPGQIRQLRAMVVALTQTALAGLVGGSLEGKRILLRRVDLERQLQERDEAFGTRSFPPPGNAPLTLPPEVPGVGEGLKVKADARALTRDQVLAALKGAQQNQSEAARNLGIARNTLARRMREFGIETEE